MTVTLWILSGLGALWWAWQGLCLFRTVTAVPRLQPCCADPPEGTYVTQICPARDEADVIGAAARARLRDPASWMSFVFIDDRSTDGTGACIQEAIAGDDRARLIRVTDLPEGWLGKVHAQQVGIESSDNGGGDEWYLFSDGDTVLEPGAVSAALAWAEDQHADHVALTPRITGGPFILRLCLAPLMRVLITGLRLWRANDDQSGHYMGVGAFNLVRCDALERAGGMEALRLEVADDLGLATIVGESGGRSRVAIGLDLVSIEWYRTTRQLLEGSEKGAAKARTRFGLILGGVVAILAVLFDVSPWIMLAWLPSGPAWLAAGVAALSVFVNVVVATRFLLPVWGAVIAPVGTIVAGVLAVRAVSLACVRGGIRWRGDEHSLSSTAQGERVRL